MIDIFAAIRSVVGEDGRDAGTECQWSACSSHGEQREQFVLTAIRKRALSEAPDEITRPAAAF